LQPLRHAIEKDGFPMTVTTRRYLLLCLLLIVALSWPVEAVAQQGDEGPPVPPSPEIAAPIYASRCANCHGAAGQGDGPQAIQANLSLPDLTDLALVRETTPARWFEVISNGVADEAMPSFGETSSNPLRQIDRWNLVFYLYTLSTPPEQVAMGQALYEMHCAECHGADGSGELEVRADFTDLARMATVSQADLFAAIADTRTEGHESGLGEVEIWAVANYVRTFSYNYASPPSAEAPAAINPFAGGAGVVSGRVINGTAGAGLPEGLLVRLRAFDMNADFIDAITTTVAADGSFHFEGIDPTLPVQLEPLVVYQDVSYFGDLDAAITLAPEQPEADVNITVYETTDDASAVRVERLHVVFDFAPDRAQVAELYILSNDADRVYVGTLETGTLRLSVPADALSFQPGGDPERYLTLADGIADTIPIPPGASTAESVLIYELAYDGELELSRPMPFDASVVNVFVPDVGIAVSSDDLRPGGPFQAQNTTFQTYLADDLAAGDRLTLRLSGEPEISSAPTTTSPHRPGGPNQAQSIAIGALALAVAVALSFLYWQGRLSLRLRPAAQDRQSALLQAIADLDDAWATGQVKDEPYRARRARLKEELLELMEAEG
jgi:mono/diheme cytochrome c family protein